MTGTKTSLTLGRKFSDSNTVKFTQGDRNVEEKNQDVPKKSQTEEVKNDKNTEGVLTK